MKTEANARPASDGPAPTLLGQLAAIDDGAILRAAFFALLAGTVSVLVVDFQEMTEETQAALVMPRPILPPAETTGPDQGARPHITTSPDTLQQPLSITLETGGELHLTGTIDPGAAKRVAGEIAARGEYVVTVVLDSPGGSVTDALAIGRLIQEKGLATRVAAGALCASSCPIVFASGTERSASPEAAIGVHQIYAAALVGGDPQDTRRAVGTAMSDAQSTTASIIAHLTATGVDPALWLHALETPPDRLYYFTPEEMTRLKLATVVAD